MKLQVKGKIKFIETETKEREDGSEYYVGSVVISTGSEEYETQKGSRKNEFGVVLKSFGDYTCNQLSNLSIGDYVVATYKCFVREYKGKYYSDLSLVSIFDQAKQKTGGEDQKEAPLDQVIQEQKPKKIEDDLPF